MSTVLEFVFIRSEFWIEGMFIEGRVDPDAVLARSTPLDALLGSTPLMLTVGFLHRGADHLEPVVAFLGGWPFIPARRDSIVSFKLVVLLIPAMCRIIVYKDTAVPTAVKALGASVEALGRLVKQHVSRSEDDFVRVAMKVLSM